MAIALVRSLRKLPLGLLISLTFLFFFDLTTCLSISDTPSNKDVNMEHQVVNAVIFRACVPMPLSERVADWGGILLPHLYAVIGWLKRKILSQERGS